MQKPAGRSDSKRPSEPRSRFAAHSDSGVVLLGETGTEFCLVVLQVRVTILISDIGVESTEFEKCFAVKGSI